MTVSQKLIGLNLISGEKISKIFDAKFHDILDHIIISPSQFMQTMWDRYDNLSPSLNGAVFEGLLAALLYREGIFPLFVQAKLHFVPNIDFDFVAYSQEYGPIILSAKTSLRERYKQADLEGMMLRHVHRKSKSYLITLNAKEAISVNKKVGTGLVMGIDEVVLATDTAFDDLMAFLKTLEFIIPPKVSVITSSRIIK